MAKNRLGSEFGDGYTKKLGIFGLCLKLGTQSRFSLNQIDTTTREVI